MMINIIWQPIAWVVSREPIANWLIKRSQKTPYSDIVKHGEVYMHRWWLFNPYQPEIYKQKHSWLPFSIRVHHIVKPDDDRHLHDHPWEARSIILRGSYIEEIPSVFGRHPITGYRTHRETVSVERNKGDTNLIGLGKFHRIESVSPGGAYTLFISGRKRDSWGFQVNGKKVPWREYLGIYQRGEG